MQSTFQISTRTQKLMLDRPHVMGILNITPDSFSDGGHFFDPGRAKEQAWKIAEEGADILDVGGESSRPGANAVSEDDERGRVWPVLKALATDEYPLPISLDSTKPALVEAAWKEGLIDIVNDIEGFRNPQMARLVKGNQMPAILMHMFGNPRTMQSDFSYEDVVQDIKTFFQRRLNETGLAENPNMILDPGIGFGKSVNHNLQLIHRFQEFHSLGCPILIGASRKSFIGKVLDAEADDRIEGSLAAAVIAAYKGCHILRVHDVRSSVRALKLTEAIGTSVSHR